MRQPPIIQFTPNSQIKNIAGYTTFLSAVEDFIATGHGSTVLAAGLFASNEKIVSIPFEEHLPFLLIALCPKEAGLSANATRYLDYLKHIFSV